MKEELKAVFEDALRENGFQMAKLISSGGIFSDDVYDRRTVYSLVDLVRLDAEGFYIDQDAGLFIFNIIQNL